MIEILVGIAVVLVAGYLFATHHDRIRQLAAALALGVTAGSALPDLPADSDSDGQGDDGSHPSEAHWDSMDDGAGPDLE